MVLQIVGRLMNALLRIGVVIFSNPEVSRRAIGTGKFVILLGCFSFCSEGCHRRTGVFFLGAQGWIQGEED